MSKGLLICSILLSFKGHALQYEQNKAFGVQVPQGFQPGDAPPEPAQGYLEERASLRSSGGHATSDPLGVLNLYTPPQAPQINDVNIGSQKSDAYDLNTTEKGNPNGRSNQNSVDPYQIGSPSIGSNSQTPSNSNSGTCSGEPGKVITVYLANNRDQVGKIVVNAPSGQRIECGARGKGTGPMTENKGDTPLGDYKTSGFGGNSESTWGQDGIQLAQQWSGDGTGLNQGRGHNETDDLFIHSKEGLDESGLAGASSWGCIVVAQDCMTKIAQALQGSANSLPMAVREGSCQ